MPAPNLLTAREVRELLRISVHTLDNMINGCYFNSRTKKIVAKNYAFPKPIMIGGKRMFKAAEVNRWLAAQSC